MKRLRFLTPCAVALLLAAAAPCLAQDTLVFTSDLHAATTNLTTYFSSLKSSGKAGVEYVAFGGDYADSWTPSIFSAIGTAIHAQYSGAVIVYTMGNHEYIGGSEAAFTSTTGYTRTGEKVSTADYAIYALGAPGTTQEFTSSDIYALTSYLQGVGTSKPVFIVSHFPIHTYGSRTTANAASMIAALNDYPNAIFVWGHNHSQGDTNYGTIRLAGSTIQYSSSGSATINFTYANAGCMLSSVAGSNAFGLVVEVEREPDDDIAVTMQFRSLSAYVGSAISVTIDVPDVKAPVASDFDADSDSDVLWHHATLGSMWLWTMNGVSPSSSDFVATVDPAYTIIATGDFTGDGKTDLLWRHATAGDMWLWTMNGSTAASQAYVATVDPAYVVIGTGDFDRDGKTDLLWRHATAGDMWTWLMNGAAQKGAAYAGTVPASYTVEGVGDLDGDGRADLVWQGAAGDVWAWLMNGAAQKSSGYIGTVADATYQIQAVADFDGDRKADLLWQGAAAGDLWLWPMNGVAKQSDDYVATVDTSYQIVGVGDYDGDMKTDLLWRGTAAGDLWVWLMNGAAMKSSGCAGAVSDAAYQIVR